ncbi:UDP-N-acetylmuramate--L-alanine ligase [Desulfonatronovibrio hydrogenovorans]|uniref:UDP-N-acetylmuramate--L-alanine ligase n=1 Tax=Desulfonatronovibrio hydrogenovorans TaxID=53245 RepID=UPI0004910AE9|nr:UDP-N-acetylmuramate--L-alanine ligase [Desulfonatronovibrio hydrogenovorans]
MKGKINRIHMVGIGGSGMSGIAEVLLNLGYEVSGSDLSTGSGVTRLKNLGATVFSGHQADNLKDAQVLVKSTAVGEDNPEVMAAREKNIPVIPRAEMLAELMRLKTGIAVAGTHGKTTTTSFLGTIFKEAGVDPTVIIGGRLNSYGSNALPGTGEYFIAEADESDGSFLCLKPIMNVVTNVDADHLDFYRDLDQIKDSFVTFMNSVPFYGMNVVCGDDPGAESLLPAVNRPVMTYGLTEGNNIRAEIINTVSGSEFNVFVEERFWSKVKLSHPGKHNILNSLAAIGISIHCGLDKEDIVSGLASFGGVGRRFEIKGVRDQIMVVDDYGHHPTEIRATIETARQCYPDRRLVVLFQPHRFSRTRALFGDFCKVLAEADVLLLTEIYPASEAPIPGVNSQSLAQGIKQISRTRVSFFEDLDEAGAGLKDVLRPGDLFITMGAGTVWKVGESFLGKR